MKRTNPARDNLMPGRERKMANDQVAAATAGNPITQEAKAPPEITHHNAARTRAGSSKLQPNPSVEVP